MFQLAVGTGRVEEWRSELKRITDVLSDPQIVEILETPKIPYERKAELVRKALPDISPHALNLAYLLVQKQRLRILDLLVEEYERMADQHLGIEHASVSTAVELDEDGTTRLRSHLERLTGKRVVLKTEVDPSIIGGFVARIGDKLIDGSTRARLELLKRRLAASVS